MTEAKPGILPIFLVVVLLGTACGSAPAAKNPSGSAASVTANVQYRRLPLKVYRQKMMAGWLGQMVGVSYGAPTEFRAMGHNLPENLVPALVPSLANNAFGQDDLYVEMTFLKTLDTYGLDVPSTQAGVDFANSEYELWHANKAGRDNLRSGIAPPNSGHPKYNAHADDIDYQIESDFAGLISPGMPNQAIHLGETFGSLMNYGDGLYGGQFMSCMVAEAFFESDPQKLVEAGLACIPAQSQYAEAIRDVLAGWQADPSDWQKTWTQISDKYLRNPDYRRFSCQDEYFTSTDFDIDAKINGAYVVLGLLYGQRDLLNTMLIAMRSGQDSDCNPSSAEGVLFTTIGFSDLPGLYTDGLNQDGYFSYTGYSYKRLVEVSEELARQSVIAAGGRIETDENGEEVFLIPIQTPVPSAFVQSWAPGPESDASFSPQEFEQLGLRQNFQGLDQFAPGWRLQDCSDDPMLGLKDKMMGREKVFITLPLDHTIPCSLVSTLTLPETPHKNLHLVVGHYIYSQWFLVVMANSDEILRQEVSPSFSTDGWMDVNVDLSVYAGKTIQLELWNLGSGYGTGGAYWGLIELVDRP
jgi:ADP-ribosylglycohydrolase